MKTESNAFVSPRTSVLRLRQGKAFLAHNAKPGLGPKHISMAIPSNVVTFSMYAKKSNRVQCRKFQVMLAQVERVLYHVDD